LPRDGRVVGVEALAADRVPAVELLFVGAVAHDSARSGGGWPDRAASGERSSAGRSAAPGGRRGERARRACCAGSRAARWPPGPVRTSARVSGSGGIVTNVYDTDRYKLLPANRGEVGQRGSLRGNAGLGDAAVVVLRCFRRDLASFRAKHLRLAAVALQAERPRRGGRSIRRAGAAHGNRFAPALDLALLDQADAAGASCLASSTR
jgi:hypothetical protein